MRILLWIQGWTGQLNSWAWREWNKLHRQDWVRGYNEWKKQGIINDKVKASDLKKYNKKYSAKKDIKKILERR